MTDSALLKTDRADKHITDLNELLSKKRPFPLVLKTNTQTGERTLGCEKDEAVVEEMSVICGDAIHNLRSALDHAYWEIVYPLAVAVTPSYGPKQLRDIQFPFYVKAKSFDEKIKGRLGHHAGANFCLAVKKLRTHGEAGCNYFLRVVHDLDIVDKHRLLVPMIDKTIIPIDWLTAIDPNHRWKRGFVESFWMDNQATMPPWINHAVPPDELGIQVAAHEFKRVLNYPVNITFPLTIDRRIQVKLPPIIEVLYGALDAARNAITVMRAAVAP